MYTSKSVGLSATLLVGVVCYFGLASGANSLDQFLDNRYILANFDADYKEVLKNIGVASDAVKSYTGNGESYMLIKKDGLYCLKKTTASKTTEMKITFGKTMQIMTGDDRMVDAVFTQEGNVIKETQTWNEGQNQATYEFNFKPTELTVLSTVDGATGTQTFQLERTWADKLLNKFSKFTT